MYKYILDVSDKFCKQSSEKAYKAYKANAYVELCRKIKDEPCLPGSQRIVIDRKLSKIYSRMSSPSTCYQSNKMAFFYHMI